MHEGKKPLKPSAPPSRQRHLNLRQPPVEAEEPNAAAEKPTASATETESQTAPESVEPTHQGHIILDATVIEQVIRFSTDLSLLNEAREFSEQIIDTLCTHLKVDQKPRPYRQKARSAYISIAKQKRPGRKTLRRGIRQQLQYLRRNLGHIEQLLSKIPGGQPLPLPGWMLYRYWVILHLYQQQWEMYQNKAHRCDHRIVSIYPQGTRASPMCARLCAANSTNRLSLVPSSVSA